METLYRKNSSEEAFSFPSTPSPSHDEYHNQQQQDSSNFEFGCITPNSPTVNIDSSPADHLFFNGKLLPHAFPLNPISNNNNNNYNINININISNIVVMDSSRTTSRTSSINRKDSLMSSRSNSTNSRSSSCSSSSTARTSLSDDNYERKLWGYQRTRIVSNYKSSSTSVAAQVYGSSQRWKIMTPVLPATTLSRESSRRKRGSENNDVVVGNIEKLVRRTKKQQTQEKRAVVVKPIRLGLRFFRWLVSYCKECHAIEPSSSRKLDHKVMSGNVKLH